MTGQVKVGAFMEGFFSDLALEQDTARVSRHRQCRGVLEISQHPRLLQPHGHCLIQRYVIHSRTLRLEFQGRWAPVTTGEKDSGCHVPGTPLSGHTHHDLSSFCGPTRDPVNIRT